MRKILSWLENVIVIIMTILLSIFTIVVAYQVLSRYLVFIPRFFWTEEISRFSFIWMIFLGASVAVRKGNHFVIDLIPTKINAKYGHIVDVFVNLLVIVCGFFMIYGGAYFIKMGMVRISTVSGIRLAWIYLSIPLSGVLIIIFSVEKIWTMMYRLTKT